MGQFSKDFNDLEFYDNFIFCKVMRNESVCKQMLKILLNLDVEKIDYLNTEQSIENAYDSKGIRMDVFLSDSSRVVDIEMQTGDYKDLILRSRYYQSAADISTVKRRTKYSELKENYILFICRDDPFGEGLPCYTKKTIFAESQRLSYDDKTHNVFYNTSAFAKAENEEIRDILHFIYTLQADSDFTRQLESFVNFAKSNISFKDEYMYFQDILEDEKEQAREIGLAEGREKGLLEGREEGLAEGREKGLEEGREKGLEEGREKGLVEGREKGLEEGRLEGRLEGQKEQLEKSQMEMLETAKKLLAMNLTVDQIILATNLPKEKVLQLV